MNPKKRILFATASTIGGGAERQLINIILSLDNNNYDIKLLITSDDPEPKEVINVGIPIVKANKKRGLAALIFMYHQIKVFKPKYIFSTSSNLILWLTLLKILFRFKFNLIGRVAVTPSELYINSIKSILLKQLLKFCYKRAYLVIAQTDFMRDDIATIYNVRYNKIKVVTNIVNCNFLTEQSLKFVPTEFDHDEFNIVASGALYSIKGFDILIKATAQAVKVNPQIKLWILGEERYEVGYKDELQRLIEELDISDNIKLGGHKNNPYPYYKHADLFVMSSRKEGFPNVVLESLFLGTPAVATNCVDFTGIISDGINGYVVNKESHSEICEAILNASKTLRKPIVTNIENFDYNNIFV